MVCKTTDRHDHQYTSQPGCNATQINPIRPIDIPVETLDITVRIAKLLIANGYRTATDLMAADSKSLYSLEALEWLGFESIVRGLNYYKGYALRDWNRARSCSVEDYLKHCRRMYGKLLEG